MLPRGEMMKLQKDSYGGESKFTQVQELKQATCYSQISLSCLKHHFPSPSKFIRGCFKHLHVVFSRQQPCQHASGVSFVGAIMDGLLPPNGRVAPVILDLMGYDASPAQYVMNKLATGVTSNRQRLLLQQSISVLGVHSLNP